MSSRPTTPSNREYIGPELRSRTRSLSVIPAELTSPKAKHKQRKRECAIESPIAKKRCDVNDIDTPDLRRFTRVAPSKNKKRLSRRKGHQLSKGAKTSDSDFKANFESKGYDFSTPLQNPPPHADGRIEEMLALFRKLKDQMPDLMPAMCSAVKDQVLNELRGKSDVDSSALKDVADTATGHSAKNNGGAATTRSAEKDHKERQQLHNNLSIKLNNVVVPSQLEHLACYFLGVALTPRERESTKSFLDLWRILTVKNIIGPGNYIELEKAFKEIESPSHLHTIDHYKESIKDIGGHCKDWIKDPLIVNSEDDLNELMQDYEPRLRKRPGVQLKNAAFGYISSEGGEVSLEGGSAKLLIPPGAVRKGEVVKFSVFRPPGGITKSNSNGNLYHDSETSPFVKYSLPIQLGPAGLTFEKSVILKLKDMSSPMFDNISDKPMKLYRKNDATDDQYKCIGPCFCDSADMTAIAQLEHFSTYVIGLPTTVAAHPLNVHVLVSSDQIEDMYFYNVYFLINDTSFIREFVKLQNIDVARQGSVYLHPQDDVAVILCHTGIVTEVLMKKEQLHCLAELPVHIRSTPIRLHNQNSALSLIQSSKTKLRLPLSENHIEQVTGQICQPSWETQPRCSRRKAVSRYKTQTRTNRNHCSEALTDVNEKFLAAKLCKDMHQSAEECLSYISHVPIDASADVNARSYRNDSPMHKSTEGGHSDTGIDAGAIASAKDIPLHKPASEGYSDTANILIDAGADVNAKNYKQDTPKHKPASEGHSDTAKMLIDAGADVYEKNYDRDAPMHTPASGGHSDIIKMLIDAGADVKAKKYDRDAPMHKPASGGHFDIVKVFVMAGADVNAKNYDWDAPMHKPASGGHFDLVRELIKAGADVDTYAKNNDGATPTHKIAEGGLSDNANVLIESGAYAYTDMPLPNVAARDHLDIDRELKVAGADVNIHAKNNDRETPTYKPTSGGHLDIVRELIKAGADVDIHAKNNDREKLPHKSALSGHTDIVSSLIEAASDFKDLDNDTPRADGDHLEFAKALIGPLADIHYSHMLWKTGITATMYALTKCTTALNQKNDQSLKPLHQAVYLGDIELVRRLIDAGAEIDINNRKEVSLLQYALSEVNTDILQAVCSNRYMCNARGCAGNTMLHVATSLGCHEHIRCLLGCEGIEVNSKDDFRRSPLFYAVRTGSPRTISDLLKAGCDATASDETQKTVLHHAAIYGHSTLVRFLINACGLDPYQNDIYMRNCLHDAVIYRREDVVASLLGEYSDPRKNYHTADFQCMKPIDYLHMCEKHSLVSDFLQGRGRVTVLDLSNSSTLDAYRPDLSNSHNLSQLSKQPYIGSVKTIFQGHDYHSFVNNVTKRVQQVVQEAIFESTSVDVIGCGSSFEGSKVGLPDEFDFVLSLRYFPGVADERVDGYGEIENSQCCIKLNIIGSYGMWLWSRLMDFWSTCASKGQMKHADDARCFNMPLPPQRHPDHKACTTWTWLYSDETFRELPVSIDIVPAFETTLEHARTRSTWLMTSEEMKEQVAHIVPTIPPGKCKWHTKEMFEQALPQLGSVSYQTLEVKYMQNLSDSLKNVYITAKCLRSPEVCGFKIRNERGDVKPAGYFVTSYLLKTVFLHLVEVFQESELSLGKMVLMVYQYLENCLERGYLPLFFDPEINVLAGSKLSTEESLQITRIMTRFVRSLYERDFSPEQRARDAAEEARALASERKAKNFLI